MAQALTILQRFIGAALVMLASGACDGPWRHDMRDQPSPGAADGPRSPAVGSISTEARGPFDRIAGEVISNPLSPETPAESGRILYTTYCFPCHGGPVGKHFSRMPSLRAPDLQRHGDGWWYVTITNGTSLMPAYGHQLDPAERWQIVRFVRTLPYQ